MCYCNSVSKSQSRLKSGKTHTMTEPLLTGKGMFTPMMMSLLRLTTPSIFRFENWSPSEHLLSLTLRKSMHSFPLAKLRTVYNAGYRDHRRTDRRGRRHTKGWCLVNEWTYLYVYTSKVVFTSKEKRITAFLISAITALGLKGCANADRKTGFLLTLPFSPSGLFMSLWRIWSGNNSVWS